MKDELTQDRNIVLTVVLRCADKSVLKNELIKAYDKKGGDYKDGVIDSLIVTPHSEHLATFSKP
jgi:hypothetical protein